MARKTGKNNPYISTGMARTADGKLKLRWSNDPDKVHMLYLARGEKDIIMIRLSEVLSKVDCVKYLKHRVHELHHPEALEVINEYLVKNP